MGTPKYRITLKCNERKEIKSLINKGISKARTLTRCRILLLVEQGQWNKSIARNLQVSEATVINIKKLYLKSGLHAALNERPRPGAVPKLDGKARARITAIACSSPPEGHSHWTLRLLADKVVELGMTDSITHAGIAKVLKKTNYNRI